MELTPKQVVRELDRYIIGQDDAKRAIATIKTIVEDPEVGAIYKGKVTRLMNFGAFVEIAPGKEGLVHISEMSWTRKLRHPSRSKKLKDFLD